MAAYGGYPSIANLLLQAGATVDAVDDDGWTALHVAAQGGYLSIVNLLLQAGATVDAVGDGGRTALHFAAYAGKIQVVEALLNAGADKAMNDHDCMTALDEAQKWNHPAIVKLLRD